MTQHVLPHVMVHSNPATRKPSWSITRCACATVDCSLEAWHSGAAATLFVPAEPRRAHRVVVLQEGGRVRGPPADKARRLALAVPQPTQVTPLQPKHGCSEGRAVEHCMPAASCNACTTCAYTAQMPSIKGCMISSGTAVSLSHTSKAWCMMPLVVMSKAVAAPPAAFIHATSRPRCASCGVVK